MEDKDVAKGATWTKWEYVVILTALMTFTHKAQTKIQKDLIWTKIVALIIFFEGRRRNPKIVFSRVQYAVKDLARNITVLEAHVTLKNRKSVFFLTPIIANCVDQGKIVKRSIFFDRKMMDFGRLAMQSWVEEKEFENTLLKQLGMEDFDNRPMPFLMKKMGEQPQLNEMNEMKKASEQKSKKGERNKTKYDKLSAMVQRTFLVQGERMSLEGERLKLDRERLERDKKVDEQRFERERRLDQERLERDKQHFQLLQTIISQ